MGPGLRPSARRAGSILKKLVAKGTDVNQCHGIHDDAGAATWGPTPRHSRWRPRSVTTNGSGSRRRPWADQIIRTLGETAPLVAAAAVTMVLLLLAGSAHAQEPAGSKRREAGLPTTATSALGDARAAPVPPEVITRDSSGGATVRAVRVATSLRIDGKLDEDVYATVKPISGFIQSDPHPGEIATEKTDLWLLFDDEHIYVTCRCWETRPDRIIANEMRRDSRVLFGGNDNLVVNLDTFYDRRTGVMFGVNPIGGRNDGQDNGEQYNGDFNPIWDFQVGRFGQGWTVEMAIPFKSLRYPAGREQTWGMVVVRQSKWKNEVSFLTKMPPSRGHRAVLESSLGATVVGIQAPTRGPNIEIKPYAISSLTSDTAGSPPTVNDVDGDFGLDMKYGVTQALTADVTYNTDFAQVEADEQQVNLTRFSLFFPEKRDFFLENQGLFSLGGVPTAGSRAGQTDAPILFYSRRIGLEAGRAVPIQAGGRITGRLGRFSIGALDIRSGHDDVTGSRPTNFTVLRLKRDILRKSSVGALLTRRSRVQNRPGANEAFGVDATLGFFTNLFIYSYWAATHGQGQSSDNSSYRVQLDYPGDRYGAQVEHLFVGDDFNPEVGFVRRDDMRRSFAQFRFSPRPAASDTVRKYSWTGSLAYVENSAGRLETREADGEFAIEFQNSDRFSVGYRGVFEFLPVPFRIAETVTVPGGGYDYAVARVGYNFGGQRSISGSMLVESGTFYDGRRTAVSVSQGRFSPWAQLAFEPTTSVNWVHLGAGAFTRTLAGARVTYTVTPMMFVSALVQYNSGTHSLSTNARLRWEYQPGSELFVVYNDERDTLAPLFPDLTNRVLIVKINRLFRF